MRLRSVAGPLAMRIGRYVEDGLLWLCGMLLMAVGAVLVLLHIVVFSAILLCRCASRWTHDRRPLEHGQRPGAGG
ncbi:hypothetical protein [Arboricoccus pini]|uniref:hypothetical protein n=1 Tax=Arboricoccus pini TaxID=1963835 RepID=UPI001A9C6B06|nr:hypothetical protein [Arboricoccus pini]